MFNLSKDEITFEVVKSLCQTKNLGGYVTTNTACVDCATDKDSIPKFVSAFANTQGGILVIATKEKDDKGILQIKGMSPDIMGNGQKAVGEGIFPSVHAEVIPIHINKDSDEVIYVVRVPQSRHAPHVIGEDCFVWTQSEIMPIVALKVDSKRRFVKYRQKKSNEILSPIVKRIEDRSRWLFETDASDSDKDKPQLSIIVRPVFADTPIISQKQLWDTYESLNYTKLVAGGIAQFTDTPCSNHFEANEYGFVYHKTDIYYEESEYPNKDRLISVFDIIDGIDNLFDWAKRLYKACDTSILIEVTAQLENVFQKKMSRNFDPEFHGRSVHALPKKNVCYDTSIYAKAPIYLSTQLLLGEHQQKIYQTLTMQLVQPFNIPQHQVIELVRMSIEPKIDK